MVHYYQEFLNFTKLKELILGAKNFDAKNLVQKIQKKLNKSNGIK